MSHKKIEIKLTIQEQSSNVEQVEQTTASLIRQLQDMKLHSIERIKAEQTPKNAMGDGFTIGALILVAVPAILPELIMFIQSWVSEQRKIVLEVPNGTKLEFTPQKRYSEEDILDLADRLNQLSQTEKT